MSWDSVTAISEIVGALAVVISLLYVAAQVKQSNRQPASDSGFALLSEFNRVDELILATPELVVIMGKLQAEEELTRDDQIRSEHFILRLMKNWMAAEISYQNGRLGRVMYNDMIADARRTFTSYPALENTARQIFGSYPGFREMNLFKVVFRDE